MLSLCKQMENSYAGVLTNVTCVVLELYEVSCSLTGLFECQTECGAQCQCQAGRWLNTLPTLRAEAVATRHGWMDRQTDGRTDGRMER